MESPMPVNSPDVPPKVRRGGLIAFLSILVLVVGALTLFAGAHLAVKGPGVAPNAQQAATGQTPPYRGAYNLKDFKEPKSS
jgi:hypothetical protein